MKIFIRDNYSGKVREYGADMHDALQISNDGTSLVYANLQNGDGSMFGSLDLQEGYSFVMENGLTPKEALNAVDSDYYEIENMSYVNIGGF